MEFGNAFHERAFCVERSGSAPDVPGAHGALTLERAAISSGLREVMSLPAAGRLRRSWTAKLRGNALAAITVVVCSMLAGALYTLAMGEDVNWDWQNYHEYNVWAVLNGRYGIDVVAPGLALLITYSESILLAALAEL
ncbi:hypothetical protein [Bradyrhizobium sp. CCBAU 45321]|uniref:hypothetical protein n=1 Tax=Bradyrhizobium sp. CCBAU 45321 TaxID=1641878 RepID=UPI0023047D14|nr:hypothetical protein [Bradyrhizobium sp. CCBAU 45321]